MKTAEQVSAQARAILTGNDRGGYTVPNARVYPFQWNWDSAFVAMGFAMMDEDRAWRELETLFLGQWADGMVPSIVFHQENEGYYPGPAAWGTTHSPPTTGITQPPVAATAARFILERSLDFKAAEERLSTLFPKLFASHRWWHEIRDPDGTGLVTVVHPWETGRDNSPDWDAPLAAIAPTVDVAALRRDKTHVNADERPTDLFYNQVMTLVEEAKALNWDGLSVARQLSLRVCDLTCQCILMRADRDLMAIAERLGYREHADTLKGWLARSRAAFTRLRHADGTYRTLDLRTGALSPVATSASFLPMYARVASEADVDILEALVERWQGFISVLVPSSDPTHPTFDSARYWRGPVWPVVNRMIADGFAAYGRYSLAERIRSDTRACLQNQGFREYFDPCDGRGLGGTDFSWSAAMWLSWAGDQDASDALS